MKRIVCFGDSNTYGYVPGVGGRFDSDTRWTGVFSKLVAPLGYSVSEEGVNGRTTVFDDDVSPDRNGSKELGGVLRRNDPIDSAVVMLGTNDCKIKFGADADAVTDGLDVIISMIQLFDPNIHILIVSPAEVIEEVTRGCYAHNFDMNSVRASRLLKDKYKELARRRGCGFLCAADYIKADPADGIHLSAESHKILAGRIAEYFRSVPEGKNGEKTGF